jgi:hypothetical protein
MIKNWQDITLEIYYEIIDIKCNNITEYNNQLLAVLEDLDIYSDDFLDLEIDYVYEKINRYKFIKNDIITRLEKNIEINNIKLELIDMNLITLGAWIDLDIYTNKYKEKSIEYINAILYRQYKVDEWGNKIYEPYLYNIDNRIKLFYDTPIDILYHNFNNWINFRKNILETYQSIFIDPEDLSDEFETENLSEQQILEIKSEIQKDKKDAEMGWQYLLLELSNNDFIKAKKLLNEPIIYIFNMLISKRRLESKQQNRK